MFSFQRWLKRLAHSRGGKKARARKAHCRPGLERLEDRTAPAALLTGQPTWVAEGPNPITGASNVSTPTSRATTSTEVGAINALAVDPSNTKHVFAATVNGGIWQTFDFTAATPTWTTTTDHLPSLAIRAIAISPTNNNVIYAGTGSYSSATNPLGAVFEAGPGGGAVGLYKSTDGGATWQTIDPNGVFTGLRIRRIVPTTLNGGQTVFVATTDTTSSAEIADQWSLLGKIHLPPKSLLQ